MIFLWLLRWLSEENVKEWWNDEDDTLEKVALHYGEDDDIKSEQRQTFSAKKNRSNMRSRMKTAKTHVVLRTKRAVKNAIPEIMKAKTNCF